MKTTTLLFTLLFASSMLFAQNFVDVSAANGITTGYGSGNLGGGVSFVDFNGDGWDDLVFPSETGDSINFYQNNNGTLFKIATPTILPTFESKQILWGDYDNDGDKDLFVTCHDGQNLLFQNDGNFNFTDVTSAAGIPTQNDPTFGATFGDYDLDGWLDLFICNYSASGSHINLLLKNNAGTFADSTVAAGLGTTVDPSFAASFLDYNNDGWPDIYVAVDKNFNNLLYKNNGDGSFTDVSIASGAGIVVDAMNSGFGDVDNDGDLDLYVTSTPWVPGYPGNVMLTNNGDGTFTDTTTPCGVAFEEVSWAGNFFDCNNDGLLDLYVSSTQFPTNANNMLYVNNGSCNFSEDDPMAEPGYSHAYGDFNQDGKLDLALNQGPGFNYRLLENQSSGTGNWLQICLQGVISNRDGIGSWVEVWIGGNKQVRYTATGTGYLNHNTQTEHFGIGTATAVDSVIVRWPSGTVDLLLPANIPGVNQKLAVIVEGSFSNPLPLELLDFSAVAERDQRVLLNWTTASEEEVDGFEIQRSTDGKNFELIGWLDAKNNATANYEFYDNEAKGNKLLYYRLKMIDFDGHYEWSPTEVVQMSSTHTAYIEALFPNPVKNELLLQYFSNSDKPVTVNVYNMLGLAILNFEIQTQRGQNAEKLDMSALIPGTYMLEWQTKEGMKESRKFVKTN